MCGITGVLHSDANAINISVLKRMTDIIAHRGPDGDGQWISNNGQVGLGHRRLSIIDLSEGGHQPMHYADNRYTITFNGEIYNYLEVKETLLKKGYTFQSSSDTEVLMALYDAEREKCLTFLDGMFAFAIWDNLEQTLFFARDRFGEKPFHYAHKPGEYFVFGSEMKSLWEFGIAKTASRKMIYRYMLYGDLMNEEDLSETFYEGILRLPAAHYGVLHLRNLSFKLTRYWDIDYLNINYQITEQQAAERFRELFQISVKRRLRSDVPVGASLSGGLDSSLVVCTIDELSKERTSTFSARFPGYIKDEGKYMQYVIDRTNVNPHFVYPDEKSLLQSIGKLWWHQEEPFGSASIFVQYEVMKLAKEKNIPVLLDGQGADEVLAGYHLYFNSFFRELKKKDSGIYNDQLQQYQELHEGNVINQKVVKPGIKDWVKFHLPAFIIDGATEMRMHHYQRKEPFLNSEFYGSHSDQRYKSFKGSDQLNKELYRSTIKADLQVLLRYADRNSMAHSREVRLPFLYHELVEFLFSLPSTFKIRDGWTKYIMRQAFKDLLPAEITWRKDKIGYEPPGSSWMKQKDILGYINDCKTKLVKEKILNLAVENSQDLKMFGPFGLEDASWKILMVGELI